jgi:hypothetical protein
MVFQMPLRLKFESVLYTKQRGITVIIIIIIIITDILSTFLIAVKSRSTGIPLNRFSPNNRQGEGELYVAS